MNQHIDDVSEGNRARADGEAEEASKEENAKGDAQPCDPNASANEGKASLIPTAVVG